MRRHSATASLFAALPIASTLLISSPATAQQPAGWVGNGHISAYTLQPGEFELSGGLSRVNDTIDFLNLREDLLSGNSRLIDNSGDLQGSTGEFRAGVWTGLEVFYKRQAHDLTLKVAPTARANILELSEQLTTTHTEWGARLKVYESPRLSTTLEVSKIDSRSEEFGGLLQRVQLNANTAITLDPPQRFSMDRLQDEGWLTRLIATYHLTDSTRVSVWAGYGESKATSGTSTELDFDVIRDAFLQTFDINETQYRAGLSINWQPLARLPLQAGYEYINISDRKANILSSNSTLLPTFLRGGNLASSATHNHTAYGSASWWFTPHLYSALTGRLFRNQFVGIMPHYNNPLSASFSETLYGYLEIKIGLKFTL